MNPPKAVKVGPLSYTVEVGGPFFQECANNAPGFLYGQCHHPTARIALNPLLTPTQLRNTLWHEIQHAVFHIHDPDSEEFWKESKDIEEDWIRLTSPTSLQVLRENPRLLEFLVAKV